MIILLLFFFSCKTQKEVLVNTDNSLKRTPKIIFLNYTIEFLENQNKKVTLTNKIIKDGSFKASLNTSQNKLQGDLKCNQVTTAGKILETKIIKNPLLKTVEYLDDNKMFHSKRLELKKASFSLRLKLLPETSYISISEIDSLNPNIPPLLKTKISP